MIASDVQADAEPLVDAQADVEADLEAPIVYAERCSKAEDPWEKGKEKKKGSRWNAVRHGCMAKLLLPADLEIEAAKWTAELTEVHRPTNDYEVRTVGNMGRIAAQLERNQQLKVVDLQRTMDRAVLCWDEDRDAYVYKLVKDLGSVPGVAAALCESKQGAEWLLRTWRGLLKVVEKLGKWSEEESRLVLDLLEIRAELRAGFLTILADDDKDGLILIVTEEMERIETRLESGVLACDDADRWLAAAGMPMEENDGTKRLRKQESKLKLEYRRAKAELLESRAQAAAAAAGPVAAPVASEPPAPVVSATRTKPAEKPAPTPRPTMSSTAWNYLMKRQDLDALELPETANSAAQRVEVRFPFPGGDDEPEPVTEDECDCEFESEAEPVVLAESDAVRPPTACVASHASRAAGAHQRRDRDRKARRDQEKKARKAARRKRR